MKEMKRLINEDDLDSKRINIYIENDVIMILTCVSLVFSKQNFL